MNAHPIDSIPAFVLGALDPEEELQVSRHVAACPACGAEADAFRATVDMLPYAAPQANPPPHVKQQLVARIAASRSDLWPGAVPTAGPRWLLGLSLGALLLALTLGYMMIEARSRLAENQQQLNALRRHATAESQMASFIMAPQTVARQLASQDRRASAMIYMQPGSSRAVVVIHGMPRLAPGKTYQFWLAKPGAQESTNTFDVDEHGAASLMIEAPGPMNQYEQAMVTIEQSGGSLQPRGQIVLSGSLASTPFALAHAIRSNELMT